MLEYSPALKNARLVAVRDAMGSGTLELGTQGMSRILAKFPLARISGNVLAGLLAFNDFPQSVAAVGSGTAASAQLKDSSGATLVSGLTVGVKDSDVILSKTVIAKGNIVRLEQVAIAHA